MINGKLLVTVAVVGVAMYAATSAALAHDTGAAHAPYPYPQSAPYSAPYSYPYPPPPPTPYPYYGGNRWGWNNWNNWNNWDNGNFFGDGRGTGRGAGRGSGAGEGEFNMRFSGKGRGNMDGDSDWSGYNYGGNQPYYGNPYGYGAYPQYRPPLPPQSGQPNNNPE